MINNFVHQKFIAKSIRLLNLIGFILSIIVIFINFTKAPGAIESRIHITAEQLVFCYLFFFLLSRFFIKDQFSHFFRFLFFILNPFIIIITLVFFYLEKIYFANFVYSHFHIHHQQFAFLSLFIFCLSLLLVSKKYLIKHFRLLFFIIPIYITFLAIIFRLTYFDTFISLTKEDSLVEYITFFLYLFSSLFSFFISSRVIKNKQITRFNKTIITIYFFLIAITSFFIAGEEISWGQRIFHITTPSIIAKHNTQQEINLHNNTFVFNYVYLFYLIIGLYGSFGFIISHILSLCKLHKIKNWLHIYIVPYFFSTFYLPIVIYVRLRSIYGIWRFVHWEEISELILAIGILLYIVFNHRYLSSDSNI